MITDFYKPETLDKAVELKKELGDAAFYLAGGTEINSSDFPYKPSCLISLADLELDRIKRYDEDELVIGSGCTIQSLLKSDLVPPVIKQAAHQIVNRNIRNMATLGGQMATNKSCADLIPVLIALRVQVDTADEGKMSIEDYLGSSRKALVTRIHVIGSTPPRQVAVKNYTRTANDISILNCAVSMFLDSDVVHDPIVVMGGVSRCAVRLDDTETKLSGKKLPQREELEEWASEEVEPITDLRGSGDFKKYLSGVMVADTVLAAYANQGGQF